jgi:hypothetical protein
MWPSPSTTWSSTGEAPWSRSARSVASLAVRHEVSSPPHEQGHAHVGLDQTGQLGVSRPLGWVAGERHEGPEALRLGQGGGEGR